MSEEESKETKESSQNEETADDPGQKETSQESTQSGPTFTDGPDPLGGLKKTTSDLMSSMEGKTVSMKVYVGTIIGIIILMLLARCGG